MLLLKFKALFRLIRPLNLLIIFSATLISPFVFLQSEPSLTNYLILGLNSVFVMAAAFIINDYVDFDVDKIINSNKVFPSGLISPLEGLAYYVYFLLLAIFSSSFVNTYYPYLFIFSAIFIYFHAKKFKLFPFVGDFLVSLFYTIPLLIGAFSTSNFNLFIFPFIFVFSISFIRQSIKNIGSTRTDKGLERVTLFSKFGFGFIYNIVTFIIVGLVFLSVQIFILKIYSIEFYIISMCVINPLLVYTLKLLRGDITILTLNRINFILKVVYLLVYVAFMAGNLFNEKF